MKEDEKKEEPVEGGQPASENREPGLEQPQKEREDTEQSAAGKESGTDRDAEVQKKLLLSLAYVFGILFFLPLIVYPDDAEARFHANQSLLLLLVTVVGEVVFGILTLIPAVGIVFSILCGVFGLLLLACCIYAIVCICRGDKGELPVIGRIRLIK